MSVASVSKVAGLLLLLGTGPALAQGVTPALQAVIDGARKAGRLDINNGPGVMGLPTGLDQARAGLKKLFGLDLDVQWSPSPSPSAQITKLYTEFRAGVDASTDILTIAAPAAAPYVGKGLFRKVAWSEMMPERVTAAIVDGDGEAIRMSTQLPGLLYNIKSAPWAPGIETMQDLLNPTLKGKFASNPFLAGIDVMLSPELWGVEKTTDYVRKFSGQISGLLRCGDAQERVATGEFPALALDCVGGDQNMPKFRDKGILDTKILKETAQRRFLYMVIPSKARHPNAAILYALYTVSPEGQAFIHQNDGADLDTFPDSGNAKRVKEYEARGFKFTDVTVAWWARQPTESMSAIGDLAKIAAHEK